MITEEAPQIYREQTAKRIRVRMAELGWNASTLAEEAGVSRARIGDLTNASGNPTTETLFKVMAAMEMSI